MYDQKLPATLIYPSGTAEKIRPGISVTLLRFISEDQQGSCEMADLGGLSAKDARGPL